jgi:hypothetical protein
VCAGAIETYEGAELGGGLFKTPMVDELAVGSRGWSAEDSGGSKYRASEKRNRGKDIPIEVMARRNHSTCHFRSSWRFEGAAAHVNVNDLATLRSFI